MITLLIGKKGSGKTKKLVEAANAAVESCNGNVVVIEPKSQLTLEISHQARLISLEPYHVAGINEFYGFLSGICAGNYDVKEIFIDSTLKIIGDSVDDFATFVEKINTLANFAETRITLSVSLADGDLPASVKAIVNTI